MTDKTRHSRFHGRVGDGTRACAVEGCPDPGEFRAPPLYSLPEDGSPPAWRWLCLDHVRAFNAGFNYFSGMTSDEIYAAQTPYAGWQRETRAFASNGTDPGPRWADFADPLDAIGARYAAHRKAPPARNGHMLSEADAKALKALGLAPDADRRAIRKRYTELVHKYHPDRNGGDRTHEKALQRTVSAYTQLRNSPFFRES